MYKTTPAGITSQFLTHPNLDIRSMVIDSTGCAYFEGKNKQDGLNFIKSPEQYNWPSTSYSVYLDFAQTDGVGGNPNPAYLSGR